MRARLLALLLLSLGAAPSTALGDPDCQPFWDNDQPIPPQVAEQCDDQVRQLASELLASLQTDVNASPQDWAWLPKSEQIATMSVAELQAMKVRAQALRKIVQNRTRLEGELVAWIATARAGGDVPGLNPTLAGGAGGIVRGEAGTDPNAVLQRKLAEYRQVLLAELTLTLLGLPPEQHGQAILDWRRSKIDRFDVFDQQKIFESLVADLAGAKSDEEKVQIYARYERDITTTYMAQEIAAEAGRRLTPLVTESDNSRPVSAGAKSLDILIDQITKDYIEAPLTFTQDDPGLRGIKVEADQWLKKLIRDLRLQEFDRIADGGLIVDPTTGQPVKGQQRDRVAKNAKLQLAEALRKSGVDPDYLRLILGWGDSREDLAAQIEESVRRNDTYRMLDLIDPSMTDADMSVVFSAMAHVIHQDVQEVLDWRAQLIAEGGEGGVPGWLYEQFVAKQKVGLGLALKIYSGEIGGVDEHGNPIGVDQRIQKLADESEAVVKAFQAAARTQDPRQLPADQHELLLTFQYIAVRPDGTEYYTLPAQNATTARLRRDLDLPGASMLDVISGVNAMKLVLMVAAPQMAAGGVVMLVQGLELGEGAVLLIYGGTAILAGATLDAGSEYIERGTVQWDRVVIESLLIGGVTEGAGGIAQVLARMATQSKALAGVLRTPETRQQAEKWLAGLLGLTSESAIQTYWSAHVQGTGVSFEEFLANMVNGAIARGAPAVGSGARVTIRQSFANYRRGHLPLPDWLQKAAGDNRTVAEELGASQGRAEELQRNFDEAAQRLLDVVGEDADTKTWTDPEVVAKVTTALQRGTLTWRDLKKVFSAKPGQLEPFMQEVNRYRLALFVATAETAVELERRDLVGEFLLKTEELRRQHPQGSPELDAALAELRRNFDRDLELINTPIKVPGSDNLTSDIDRSIASPRVRNRLKRLVDEAFGGEGPATSAQAFDVNEYIDVFLIINRQRGAGLSLAALPVEGTGLTHGQLVQAASYAHAMQHMTPAERARFKENLVAQGSLQDRGTILAQLAHAEASLSRGENELKAELQRIGADPLNPTADQVLRARDNLYGKRTVELREMEARLERMDPKSEEYAKLSAEIERGWNFALREGIEAYSDFTGLEVIVTEGQLKKRSIRSLIDDPSFTAQGQKYTPQQVSAFIHNQTGMIVEHMHAYWKGEESATEATSAVGKYAERAILGLKLEGVDLKSGALAELDAISAKLVEARKDPAALRAALAEFGSGSEDAGLRKLAALLEQALPGMQNMLLPGGKPPTPEALAARAPLARAIALLALQREKAAEVKRARLEGGIGGVVGLLDGEIKALEDEKRILQREDAETDRLRRLYLREDWQTALRLEDQRAAIWQQYQVLPDQDKVTQVGTQLEAEEKRLSGELQALTNKLNAYPGGWQAANPRTDDDRRRAERLAKIDGRLADGRGARDQLAVLAEQEKQHLADLPLPTDDEGALPQFGSYLDRLVPLIAGPIPGDDGAYAVGDGPAVRDRYGLDDRAAADVPGEGEPGFDPHPDEPPAVVEEVEASESAADLTPTRSVAEQLAELDEDEEDTGTPTDPVNYTETLPEPDYLIEPGPANCDPQPPGDPPVTAPPVLIVNIDQVGLIHDPIVIAAGRTRKVQLVIGEVPPVERGPAAPGPTPNGQAPGGASRLPDDPEVRVHLESRGMLGAGALNLELHSREPGPVRLAGGAIVLEPVEIDAMEREKLRQQIDAFAARGPATATADAYCLESGLELPTEGTVFRIAAPEIQRAYQGARDVLDASRRVLEAGGLHPDSDPGEYFQSIRQWAVWALEDGLDENAFGEAFLEKTKQNFQQGGQPWTDQIQNLVSGLVPNRWRDVAAILHEAGNPVDDPGAAADSHP
jgi:hypothetical protein